MEDIFEKKICSICKNNINCNYFNIIETTDGLTKVVSCKDYLKDSSKIIPYEPPLIVTAKRDYIHLYES